MHPEGKTALKAPQKLTETFACVGFWAVLLALVLFFEGGRELRSLGVFTAVVHAFIGEMETNKFHQRFILGSSVQVGARVADLLVALLLVTPCARRCCYRPFLVRAALPWLHPNASIDERISSIFLP